jgi:hypothetical protein
MHQAPRAACAALLLAMVSVVSPANAGAILGEPVLGGQLVVASAGQDVIAQFLGSDAGYYDSLYSYLYFGGASPIFGKQTPSGTEVNLGSFNAGTELDFRMYVSNTGLSYFTGDAQRNPDGLAHALTVTSFDASTGTYVTTVGLEDLYNGGDRDYNDLSFRLFNVIDPLRIPEPATLALLGLGLTGIGFQQRRRMSA